MVNKSKVLTISLKTFCESKCIFCEEPGFLKMNDEGREFQRVRAIINGLDATVVRVAEIGGREPLNFKYLSGVVALVKTKGIKEIFIQTSGLKLKNRKFVESLIKAGLTGLRIPIYGSTQEIHESITGHPGSFSDLIMALDNLNSHSKKVKIYLHNLVLRKNYADIESLVKFLTKKYPNMFLNVRLLEPLPSWTGKQYKFFAPAYSQFVSSIINAMEFYKRKYPASSEHCKSFSRILFSIPPCVVVASTKKINVDHLAKVYSDILSHMLKWQNEMVTKRYLKPRQICDGCDLSNFCPGIPDYYVDFFRTKEFKRKSVKIGK